MFTLAMLCLVLIQTSNPLSIPELTTRGSHYEIGHDMGYTFKTEIDEYFTRSKLQTRLLPFINTTEGKKYYDGYLSVVKSKFPQYMDEMQGIADGSGRRFIEVFTQMISSELYAVMKLQDHSSGCSDVYVNNLNSVAICHNEDGDPLVKDRGYMVHAIVVEKQSGTVLENFTSYTYPGSLPGYTFGFNSDGKVFTVNALYPRLVKPNQIPRTIISRAMMRVKSQKELEELFRSRELGVAYGFNVNFADLLNGSRMLVDYEITSQSETNTSQVGRREVGLQSSKTSRTDNTGYYFHFNMFEILKEPQFTSSIVSSQHRKARAVALPAPTNIPSALNILGDTADPKYPIYRHPRPTDEESTEATAVFDLLRCVLLIYKTNPKTGRPLMSIPLPHGAFCRSH